MEINANDFAARKTEQFSLRSSNLDIYVDILVAIKAFNFSVVKFKYLNGCIKSLNLINFHKVKVIWVPGFEGIRGNEKTVECAVHKSSLDVVCKKRYSSSSVGQWN